MGYAEDLDKTREELAKLGPLAVTALRKRLEGGAGQLGEPAFQAAQDILDRLGFHRSDSTLA